MKANTKFFFWIFLSILNLFTLLVGFELEDPGICVIGMCMLLFCLGGGLVEAVKQEEK